MIGWLVPILIAVAGVLFGLRQRQRRREATELVVALREQLAALERRLEGQEKLTSLGMLAASVAHEINNPMAYVTANVQALQQDLTAAGSLTPALQEHLDEILPATLDGIARINAIVADLRTYSREDPGQVEEFDLNEQVEAALRIASGQFRHRARLEKNLGRIPKAIGKPRQITQVIVNLLVNAAQAIEDQGRIAITTRCDPDEFTVEVRDDGVGMTPDVRDRIFEPFFSTKAAGRGTGLGLAVAQGIVRSHGGRISVESAPGHGSTFRIGLPRVSLVHRRLRRAEPPVTRAV